METESIDRILIVMSLRQLTAFLGSSAPKIIRRLRMIVFALKALNLLFCVPQLFS
jgi:hypothetical protein